MYNSNSTCAQEKLHKYTGWARGAVNSIIKDLQTVNLKLEWPSRWVVTISEGAFDLFRMRLQFFWDFLENPLFAKWQNGTFEPVHEIWNFFWPKAFFWSIMKMARRKNIHNMPQGLPIPGFMQEKVQKGDLLKKPSRELIFFLFYVPMNPSKA